MKQSIKDGCGQDLITGQQLRPVPDPLVCRDQNAAPLKAVADQPEEFARKAVALMKNQKLRLKLGKAGRALVRKEYDWSKIGRKLEKLYLQFIKNVQKT